MIGWGYRISRIFSTSGGDVSATEVQFVDAEPGQVAGSPSPLAMTGDFGVISADPQSGTGAGCLRPGRGLSVVVDS